MSSFLEVVLKPDIALVGENLRRELSELLGSPGVEECPSNRVEERMHWTARAFDHEVTWEVALDSAPGFSTGRADKNSSVVTDKIFVPPFRRGIGDS
ncbi:MAG: hypothetical protein AB7U98_13675 [Candidatus Nitrosocosmicus sp.]